MASNKMNTQLTSPSAHDMVADVPDYNLRGLFADPPAPEPLSFPHPPLNETIFRKFFETPLPEDALEPDPETVIEKLNRNMREAREAQNAGEPKSRGYKANHYQGEGFFWSNTDENSTVIGPSVHWTRLPCPWAIKEIACAHLGVSTCQVTDFPCSRPHAKAFRIDVGPKTYMMRVILPVYPHLRTLSEVATTNFVCEHTDMPVPEIVAFDATCDNALGFEYILSSLVIGIPFPTTPEAWSRIPKNALTNVAKKLANWDSQFFNQPWNGPGNQTTAIGSLFQVPSSRNKVNKTEFSIGPLVCKNMHQSERLTQPIKRTAYATAYDWFTARLTLIMGEHATYAREDRLMNPRDRDTAEQDTKPRKRRRIANKLLAILPYVSSPELQEPTLLLANYAGLMLDPVTYQIVCVPEWDEAHVLPRFEAGLVPTLLYARTPRHSEPKKRDYLPTTVLLDSYGLDRAKSLLQRHRMEWEHTQLGNIYTSEMEAKAKGYAELFNSEAGQEIAQFTAAVKCIDIGESEYATRVAREMEHDILKSMFEDEDEDEDEGEDVWQTVESFWSERHTDRLDEMDL